jgi:hypothetical protein
VCPSKRKNYLYSEFFWYHVDSNKIRLQEQELLGIFPGPDAFKPFGMALGKVAA